MDDWQLVVEWYSFGPKIYGVEQSDRCFFGELEFILHQQKGISLAYLKVNGRHLICGLEEVSPIKVGRN